MSRTEPADGASPAARDRDDLQAAREGSAAAGRRLVERHGRSMLRTAWRVLGRFGQDDAEDVVQDALVAALTTSALPKGDVGAWLRAIAARKALDHLRAERRRGDRPADDLAPGLDPPSPSQAPLDVLAVRRALARLRPLDRAVLTLVDLEGHGMAEAARLLGTTRVAIKWRAVRARRRLAKLLGPTGSGRPGAAR